MIGQLTGTVIEAQAPEVLVAVGGVGYELLVPMTTYDRLPAVGESATLWTHLVIREDAHSLYGFAERSDRQLFRTLIRVNGVGPKVALSILSAIPARDFIRYIDQEAVSQLTRVPGVGKKMAERLVLELQGKLVTAVAHSDLSAGMASAAASDADAVLADAESALVTLGYKPAQISRMLKQVYTEGMSSDAVIRAALKSAV